MIKSLSVAPIVASIFYFGSAACQSGAQDDRAEKAAQILVTLCVSGGSVTISRSEGQFRIDSNSGDSAVVQKRDARGLVDGIGAALNSITADQANRARDCMRPYISQILALVTGKSSALSEVGGVRVHKNEKLTGISVLYYRKTADGSRVADALKQYGISFTELSAVLSDAFHANAILCGVGTPVAAIKQLALALIDSGIPVQHIERISSSAKNVLYVVSRVSIQHNELASRPLSRAQIDDIVECPRRVDQFIANYTHFENPHPSGRSDDTRYIDIWFDQDHNKGAKHAAGLFCTKRGFADAAWYKVRHLVQRSVVALRVGDKSRCLDNCRVFASIDCE
jgi:hypothetical protein